MHLPHPSSLLVIGQFWALELKAQEEAPAQSYVEAQWLECDFSLGGVGGEILWLLFFFKSRLLASLCLLDLILGPSSPCQQPLCFPGQ